MEKQYEELKTRLLEIDDLNAAAAVLNWDQTTYMPQGGAAARARQLATLSRLAHEKFIDPAVGRLLDDLRGYEEGLPYESDEASLIRVTRRDYERATRVSPALMGEFYAHSAASYQVWATARPNNDFAAMAPYLEKTLELSRQIADSFPGYDHIADPLIDFYDEGMKASTVRALFADLREQVRPLLEAIQEEEPIDDSVLKQHYAEEPQLEFGRSVIKAYGYDSSRGRQDKTHHPFMTSFSIGDVRITTRVNESDLNEALFSTLHEAGHALYEQGIARTLEGTPLAKGTSAGVHESQSRLWENLVGRSRGFWEHYYPRLQATFPRQLNNVPLERFFRAINKVEPSLIRTDADEVTYNLHVMIRFDLELALLEGSMAVADLPEAWHARYESDLGVRAPSDVNGVLQDVHWFAGTIGGAFQGYTLGNIMGAAFYEAALAAHPEIPEQIAAGEFATLHDWLKEHIYQHGSKFTANELIKRVTGETLSIQPYLRYLNNKFCELYGVDLELGAASAT